MRHYPEANDKYDQKEVKRLQVAPWQLDLLKLNPSYCSWGPHEDYMWRPGAKETDKNNPNGQQRDYGWESRILSPNWTAFRKGDPADESLLGSGGFDLDELNECVNFYFQVNRESEGCKVCGRTGYHPDALWITESFYSHSSPFTHRNPRQEMAHAIMQSFGAGETGNVHGNDTFPTEEVLNKYGPEFRAFCERMRTRHEWCDDITDDEAKALADEGRLHHLTHTFVTGKGWEPKNPPVIPTAADVNSAQKAEGGFISHDAINRSVLIEQRCKRLGVPRTCTNCDGYGYVYTAPTAHVSLVLWWLHPRKGCSRGIEIARIEQHELPEVFAFLKEAADRNAERFAKVVKKAKAIAKVTK